jgi:myo-inositol 2-dehydrogenase/D-chiro-inositol 1-dehydrogenase
MLNVAVVGLGAVGRIHVANLAASQSANLSAVCDIRAEVANEFATRHGVQAFDSVSDVLASGSDALIIASSTASHGDVAQACISAGVPFLCEKPLARDLESAITTAAAAKASGLMAATALNRRFDVQYTGVRDALRNGDIGQPEILCFTSRSGTPPSVKFTLTSGGLFGEKGSHFFDLARWISGEDPIELFAMGSVMINQGFAEIGEADTALIMMRMPSGLLCRFDFSWRSAYGQDERLELHGSRAMLQTRQAPVGSFLRLDGEGLTHPGLMPTWQDRFADTYKQELDAFVTACETGKRPVLASLEDGVAAQRIAEAAKRSAETGAKICL